VRRRHKQRADKQDAACRRRATEYGPSGDMVKAGAVMVVDGVINRWG
jgi:hypothetical protein